MATKKETYEQAKVKEFLKDKLGAYVIKAVVTAAGGTPDLIVCFKGVFIGIEMKKEGAKTKESFGGSPLQNKKLEKIIAAGGIGFVAETLEEVKFRLGNELIRRGIDTTPIRAN